MLHEKKKKKNSTTLNQGGMLENDSKLVFLIVSDRV